MKLMIDEARQDVELLVEQKNPNEPKKHYITGPFMVAEVKNQNGRIYKKNVLEEAVKIYDKDFIQKNAALGEMCHPTSAALDYERAVIKIQELKQADNVWFGKAIILEGTPLGDLLKTQMFDYGIRYGVSSRGAGSLNEAGIVDKDYILSAIDVVNDPSGTMLSGDRCFIDGILESKNFMIDEHGALVEMVYDKMEKSLKALPVKGIDRNLAIKGIFDNFISSL